MDRKKAIAAILAIILLVAGVIAWSTWRKQVTRQQQEENRSAIARQHRNNAKPKPAITSQQAAEYKQTAIQFEKTSREWGTDPQTAVSDTNAGQDTNTVLNRLRTPATMNPATLDTVSSIKRDKDTGPDAPSPYCDGTQPTVCAMTPTMLDYWRNQAWILGARMDGTPDTTVNDDGTIDIKGRMKVVIWGDTQDAPAYQSDDGTWWNFTPVTGYVSYADTLTIGADGRVSRRVENLDTDFIIDPWYETWDSNPMGSTSHLTGRAQASIPLKGGVPSLGMNHDPNVGVVKNLNVMQGGQWARIFSEHSERMQQSEGDNSY